MKVNLIVIRTSQLKKLATLYQLLGLKFDYHRHGKGPMHYSTTIGEIVFEIYPLLKNQKQADTSLRIGFTVEDLGILIEKLEAAGVEIIQKPHQTEWGYMAVVKDWDGRKVELKQDY